MIIDIDYAIKYAKSNGLDISKNELAKQIILQGRDDSGKLIIKRGISRNRIRGLENKEDKLVLQDINIVNEISRITGCPICLFVPELQNLTQKSNA